MRLCFCSVLRGHHAAAANAGLRARYGPGPHTPVQGRGCGALLRVSCGLGYGFVYSDIQVSY